MSARPTIEVVLPAYRPQRELLARAIESARRCAQVSRVLVVDDGSPDPVDLDPLELPGGAPPVVLLRKPNGGPASARNHGMARVRADFALMLDDDDELVPDGVDAAVDLARRLSAAAVVPARRRAMPDGTWRPGPIPPEWADAAIPRKGDVFRPLAIFGASGTLVAKHVWQQDIWYDETLWVTEDREFLRRVADAGPIGMSSPVAVRARARDDGSNLTASSSLSRWITSYAAMQDRWLDDESRQHFADQARWLAKRCARARVDNQTWQTLTAAMARARFPVPLKARLARLLHPGVNA